MVLHLSKRKKKGLITESNFVSFWFVKWCVDMRQPQHVDITDKTQQTKKHAHTNIWES